MGSSNETIHHHTHTHIHTHTHARTRVHFKSPKDDGNGTHNTVDVVFDILCIYIFQVVSHRRTSSIKRRKRLKRGNTYTLSVVSDPFHCTPTLPPNSCSTYYWDIFTKKEKRTHTRRRWKIHAQNAKMKKQNQKTSTALRTYVHIIFFLHNT